MLNEQDTCCLVDPGALDPEVRTLGDHLAVSRDLLITYTLSGLLAGLAGLLAAQKGVPFMPIAVDAYMADCGHLSNEEHGCYLLLLLLMWRTPNQRLPNDDRWLARKLNRTLENIETAFRPIIQEFCQCDGNWITQKRLLKVRRYIQKQSQAQSDRAKSRWNKEKDVCPRNAAPHASGNASKYKSKIKLKLIPTEDKDMISRSFASLVDFAPDVSIAFQVYNTTAKRVGWPEAQKLSDTRQKKMLGRLKDAGGLEGFKTAIAKAEASEFLTETWKGFGIDWLLEPRNFTKVMEGNYDRKSAEPKRGLSAVLSALANDDHG